MAQCLGDELASGNVLLAGEVEELVELVEGQGDLGACQQFFSGPLGDLLGAVFPS